MREYLSYKENKFGSTSIIKYEYFILTKSIYTIENKNPNGFSLAGWYAFP